MTGAGGAYGQGMSSSSLCISVRGSSLSFADVLFVLVAQELIIPQNSVLFAESRVVP
jgi:hypothetical protein